MNGCVRGVLAAQSSRWSRCSRRLGQVGLQDDAGARAVGELGLESRSSVSVGDRLARVEGLHVDVQVRADLLGDPQQVAQARSGALDPALGRLGAQSSVLT